MIFWLYFRQGMSTKEIASMPAIGLSAKGVGSVIERLKHCLREQIIGIPPDSDEDSPKSKSPAELVIALYGPSERGTTIC